MGLAEKKAENGTFIEENPYGALSQKIPCYQYEMGQRKDIPPFPCYETEIFARSEFGAGVDHSGPRRGTGRKIRNVIPCELAIFTTVDAGRAEEERYIFGFFVIKDHYEDHNGATKIVGYPEYTLKIPKDSRLRFWDFYRNRDGSIFGEPTHPLHGFLPGELLKELPISATTQLREFTTGKVEKGLRLAELSN